MLTILNLFGKSPFTPLQAHMEKVAETVDLLPSLFKALEEKKQSEVIRIATLICEKEKQADLARNEIRGHLPKTLFLAIIDRAQLLEILSLQDQMADEAEDIAVLVTLRALELPKGAATEFMEFLNKNLEAFAQVRKIIQELGQLLESSFGGAEAKKVQIMADEAAFLEHDVDLAQKKLLISFYNAEKELTFVTFHLWQEIFTHLGQISNLAEKLALRIQLLLELKR